MRKATKKQISYILNLARRQGYSRDALELEYEVDFDNLSMDDASYLIWELEEPEY